MLDCIQNHTTIVITIQINPRLKLVQVKPNTDSSKIARIKIALNKSEYVGEQGSRFSKFLNNRASDSRAWTIKGAWIRMEVQVIKIIVIPLSSQQPQGHTISSTFLRERLSLSRSLYGALIFLTLLSSL